MNADPPIPDELRQQIPPAAQAAIRTLIQRYERRLADLEARLNQNSTNSSKPPSSDPPTLKRSPPVSVHGLWVTSVQRRPRPEQSPGSGFRCRIAETKPLTIRSETAGHGRTPEVLG